MFLSGQLGNFKKKKQWWEFRCPYMLCPSNQPYRGALKARMKAVMKISPTVFQYKCKDCGCLTNLCEEPKELNQGRAEELNPSLLGHNSFKPGYNFK